jgi:hypothetical protein
MPDEDIAGTANASWAPQHGAGNGDTIKIDPTDSFDVALYHVWETARRKRQDYASPDDRYSNFLLTSNYFGITDYQAADFNELQKLARLRQLNQSGILPQNESVLDSYLDKAVYAVLALGMYMKAHGGLT